MDKEEEEDAEEESPAYGVEIEADATEVRARDAEAAWLEMERREDGASARMAPSAPRRLAEAIVTPGDGSCSQDD